MPLLPSVIGYAYKQNFPVRFNLLRIILLFICAIASSSEVNAACAKQTALFISIT